MQFLKQSTGASIIVGPVLDATGLEYASALIGDISVSSNGGASSALANTATLVYIANGFYTLTLRTTDTATLGRLDIICNKSTYQMPPVRLEVLQPTVFDAFVTNAAGGLNGLPLSKANNIVDSNVISVGPTGANTAQTAGDLYAYLTTNLDAAVSTRLATSGYTAPDNTTIAAINNAISALNDLSATDLFTSQMTESYAADGTAPTLAQCLFLIQQSLHEFSISGTSRTVKKLDGTTTAAVFTLDSASAPTSTTRTS